MSLHSSLSVSMKARKQRSVLKRIERIKHFISKGVFNEQSPVYGLPKIKLVKIKVKKEKTEEKAATAQSSASAAKPESAPATKTAKGAAQAKA